jgi:hypothetical protein
MTHNPNPYVLRRLLASFAKDFYLKYSNIWCANINNTDKYEEYHLFGYRRVWWYCFWKTKFLLSIMIVYYQYNEQNVQIIKKVEIRTAGYPTKMKNLIDLLKKFYLDDIPIELDFYSDEPVEDY